MNLRRQVFKISIGQILLILIIIIVLCAVVSAIKGDDTKEDKVENKVTEEVQKQEGDAVKESEDKNEFVDTTVSNSNFSNVTTKENFVTETTSDDEIIYVTNVKDNGDNTYTLSGIKYKKYMLTASEARYELEDGEMSVNGEVYTVAETDEVDVYDLYADGSDFPIYRLALAEDRNYYLTANTELSDCWELTDETVKLVVDSDVDVENAYEEIKPAEEIFGNMENSVPEDSTHPNGARTFRFEFEDGKCTYVTDVLTSI